MPRMTLSVTTIKNDLKFQNWSLEEQLNRPIGANRKYTKQMHVFIKNRKFRGPIFSCFWQSQYLKGYAVNTLYASFVSPTHLGF